ncbi:MAG TPA: four helix bundle protein [Usitatibacter sp.]|nr:four helix bundle protein [Usitatibacter sp.]
MGKSSYRGLDVWVKSRLLAVDVFRTTAAAGFDWSLRDQMRRAAISIPSNIAEGSKRGSNRDCVRFLYISRGSAAELSTQIDIAKEVKLVEPDVAANLLDRCDHLEAMLTKLIVARRDGR